MAEAKKTEAVETAEEIEGAYVHQFRTPFTWDGKEYDSLTFDFDNLTGGDLLKVVDEMAMLGTQMQFVRETDTNYQLGVAVRACKEKLPRDAYLAMKFGDLSKIVSRARSFLLTQGL